MPIQQFRTYDIIVDIAPGALALLLPALIIPQPYTSVLANANGILASVNLLLAGFLAGRLLHALSGGITRTLSKISRFESDDDSLKDLIQHGQKPETKPDDNDTETDDDTSESDNTDFDLPDDINRTVLTKTIESIQKRMTDQKTDPEEKSSPTPKSIRRYGETLLYDKTTLHHRYEILTTFYRSLAVLLLLGYAIIYAAYGTIVLPSHEPVPLQPYTVTALLVLAYTAYSRYGTFTGRRNHAFVYDIHRHLTAPPRTVNPPHPLEL